jgi:hypothetical protein
MTFVVPTTTTVAVAGVAGVVHHSSSVTSQIPRFTRISPSSSFIRLKTNTQVSVAFVVLNCTCSGNRRDNRKLHRVCWRLMILSRYPCLLWNDKSRDKNDFITVEKKKVKVRGTEFTLFERSFYYSRINKGESQGKNVMLELWYTGSR